MLHGHNGTAANRMKSFANQCFLWCNTCNFPQRRLARATEPPRTGALCLTLENFDMKKTLIALAVLAASGAAMAQSSVTLYGVADLSVGKIHGAKVAAHANDSLNNGNSRLGFKGVEDLGGGLKVSFNIEGAVNLADGSTQASTYQRAAWLQLDGGFGSLRAGRSLSPHYYAIANYELTGTANYSAEGIVFGSGGATRNSAEVAYSTPNMSGFKGTLATILSGNNGGHAKTELAATYNNGPLALGFGYDKTSGSEKNLSLGGSYDLGQFIVAASYQDPAGAKKGFTIGGTVKLGANTVTLDIARDTGSAVKSTDYVLEAKEPLSKRTFLYQAVYRAGVDRAAAGLTKGTSFSAGLRHNF